MDPFIKWDGARSAHGIVTPPLCTSSTRRSSRLALNETGRRRECVGDNQRIPKAVGGRLQAVGQSANACPRSVGWSPSSGAVSAVEHSARAPLFAEVFDGLRDFYTGTKGTTSAPAFTAAMLMSYLFSVNLASGVALLDVAPDGAPTSRAGSCVTRPQPWPSALRSHGAMSSTPGGQGCITGLVRRSR